MKKSENQEFFSSPPGTHHLMGSCRHKFLTFIICINFYWSFYRRKDRFPFPTYILQIVKSYPYPFIYLKPEKGTPFGWSLPVQAILRSDPRKLSEDTFPRQNPSSGLFLNAHDQHYIGTKKLSAKRFFSVKILISCVYRQLIDLESSLGLFQNAYTRIPLIPNEHPSIKKGLP